MADLTWKCEKCGFEINTGNYCGMCGSAKKHVAETRMQRLTCEMCGGNDIVKENGLYICRHCGTKYSVEEAKQLFINGTVKIDNSHKLNNLYQLARRAVEEQDYKGAQKYYEQILLEQPDKWEPVFYAAYCKARGSKVEDVVENFRTLKNKLNSTFMFLNAENKTDRENGIINIAFLVNELVFDTDINLTLSKDVSGDPQRDYYKEDMEDVERHESLLELLDSLITRLTPYTDNERIVYYKYQAKKRAVSIMISLVAYNKEALADSEIKRFRKRIEKDQKEIAAYDPNYKIEKIPTLGFCYIATAVYGSYDCPQVWVLRRFRDKVLMLSLFGKLFVKTYYAVSPMLLKLAGDTKVFKAICLKLLNVFVGHLKRNGYSDKPYVDP